jgi:hypothetical protein
MKATRSPSPLREFDFDPNLRLLGRPPASDLRFVLLTGEDAAAVRRRRKAPKWWVQLHLGFLCDERSKVTRRVATKWQLGRQLGQWAWTTLEAAVRFMGALEIGQGQPAVVSTWAPAWMDRGRLLTLQVGRPTSKLLPDLCWTLPLRGLPPGSLAAQPGEKHTVWRLKVGRQHADTDVRAWVPAHGRAPLPVRD